MNDSDSEDEIVPKKPIVKKQAKPAAKMPSSMNNSDSEEEEIPKKKPAMKTPALKGIHIHLFFKK